ncbi:MAG: sodC [Fibrobacteres bacterium]|nr:sodC [Fibrobacterota bacterium]
MKALPLRMKTLAIAAPLAGLLMAGCWNDNDNDSGTSPTSQFPLASAMATAAIRGYTDSNLTGTVTFKELGDSILVQGTVSGLFPGTQYAIHVHQFGNCTSPEASGGHFASAGEIHGNPFDTLPSHHRGDLPNLQVDTNGVGHFEIITGVFTLSTVTALAGGPIKDSAADLDTASRSVLGRSVVVHALPDDYMTQPAGGSDGRIGCGIIGLVTGNPTDTTVIKNDTTGTKDTTTIKTDTIPVPVPVDTAPKPPSY